ncbi:TPA: MarR family transcriptional regulator [Klebsiella pneumoniae]|jgi:DNA-binding MarR family transcriptional regulator|uniref:MarR family winged helix-turn-helix transcriptional regulator n=1 Tax=Enterobacteriaceae TaxID=543 RepID=UPI001274C619|nr:MULTISPECIES: MarR family transcriptional regulator [Klebsiella]EBR1431362.1 MarR family transcriptional regulator [Salmonella enterica]EDD0893307.1 MarR family transcriptional regulator [Salmonella enterica subsp. enterica serovar Enteritidis]ELP0887824.1 MarR family transcriptional regulator [Klebsiella oxytoca]MBK4556180.1 MarR family transcriptional regulator [Enterobacter hormaechei]MBK4628088.1 MarR family transcriptional regulator [Enterobacter hormaechei]
MLTKNQFEALSEFRYQLKRFLHFSEAAAKEQGITPLQYLLLLHIRGYPGRNWATVGELAERLQMNHNATVALLTRCEELDLVERRKNEKDRRKVEIHLTAKGDSYLQKLAQQHKTELQSLQKTFQVAQITAFNEDQEPTI